VTLSFVALGQLGRARERERERERERGGGGGRGQGGEERRDAYELSIFHAARDALPAPRDGTLSIFTFRPASDGCYACST
jgi:hypothetical protein